MFTSAVPIRRIALLTLFAFGCATVRIPVTAPDEPADGAGVIAPPIVELWIESSDQVPPELAASTEARTRSALGAALAECEIPSDAAGATDAVLFTRERAVAVTEARHSQQNWAKVGIVVGIVVVVAAVEPWYAPEPPAPLAVQSASEVAMLAEPPPPEPDPIAAVALQLPPLADAVRFSVHDRGFFAGPQTAIQLDLLDRATGELLWSKAVSAEADPTDAKAMSKLVSHALAGQPWARRFP